MGKFPWDSWFSNRLNNTSIWSKYTQKQQQQQKQKQNSSRGANLESTLLPPQSTWSLWAYENTVTQVFLKAIEENCFKYFLVSSTCASVLPATYLYLYLCWIQTEKGVYVMTVSKGIANGHSRVSHLRCIKSCS